MHANRATNAYRTTHVASSPARALLALLERLFRDMDEVRTSIIDRDIPKKGRVLGHALLILGELRAALDPAVAPELCQNLNGLYEYCGQQLLQAGNKLDPQPVEAAQKVVSELVDAFRKVIESGV
jgi:flagellar protein FliS